MRPTYLIPALALLIAAWPAAGQNPPKAPAPKPYKAVPITLPKSAPDASFEAMRKQLAEAAERKDRAALTKLVVGQGFFWDRENGDGADKRKPGVDNLSTALGLANKDAAGWDMLATYADEPTVSPSSEHKGAMCAPADPVFNGKDFDNLVDATGTDPIEWGYPVSDGIEVRSAGEAGAPVVDKLGLYFVRIMPDSITASPSFVHIVMPSGKTGYVSIDSVAPMGNDQICYVKDAGAWKIGGYVGGGDPQ